MVTTGEKVQALMHLVKVLVRECVILDGSVDK